MSQEQENLPRAFKGIWIPREIWLHPDLGAFEKVLWAEIDSLDDPETGCIASNSYLCKLLNTQERTLQNALSKLKNFGLIRYESFDGRKRILRSCLKTTYEKFDTPDLKKSSPLPCKNLHPERIVEKKEEITTPTPSKGKHPAQAGPPPLERGRYGRFVELNKEEFDSLRELVGSADLLSTIINEMNDYLAATGKKPYKDYAAALRNWIRRRKENSSPIAADPSSLSNQQLCEKIKKKFKHPDITVGSDYIEFYISPVVPSEYIKFSEKGFEERVLNRLKKWNLDTGDL